jgi:hypothetical protein
LFVFFFFPLLRRGLMDLGCSHQVPNEFPTCLFKFLTCSPTYSQFHLTLSHMLCPPLYPWNLPT